MRKKLKVLSILATIIFLSAAVIGIFKQEKELKAGILTKGRILYKSSGMKKEDEEKQAKEKAWTQIEEGTVLEDATEGKVLVNYEYWDKNGKKHTGKYYAVLPGNVKSGVKYGAYGTEYTGTLEGKFLPQRTGQISNYRANDDGTNRKGYTAGYTNADGSWDGNTRFSTNSDGTNTTVLDNLTGLMWTRDANQVPGTKIWNDAVDGATSCTVGGYNDWRLPNVRELLSLIDYRKYNPALPAGHPFTGVQNNWYWTSTTPASTTSSAVVVSPAHGGMGFNDKATILNFVWYCRLGQ